MKAFVYAEFDTEPKLLIEENGTPEQPVGKPVLWADFSESKNAVIQLKYAISFISAEQAEKNLKTTPESDCALNALAIDDSLEYARLYLDGNLQMWVDAEDSLEIF